MTPRQEIAAADRQIDAIHRELQRREQFDEPSAEGWRLAWSRHPDLTARSNAAWLRRGTAQLARDSADAAMRRQAERAEARRRAAAYRARKPQCCPTCGAPTRATYRPFGPRTTSRAIGP